MKIIKDKNLMENFMDDKLNVKNIYAFKKYLLEYSDPKKLWKLIEVISADNRKELKKLFGKPLFYYDNGEFKYHTWCVEFQNKKILIMSAKEYGTRYEMIIDKKDDDKNNIDEIEKIGVEFLKEIYSKLKPIKDTTIING